MASSVETFVQDKKNIDNLARYLATLYERIVQPEKLATKLYSINALPDLPEFSVWEIRGNVALTRHIIEESFKRRAVKELLDALQQSGNDHVYKEISDWAQKEVKKEIQENGDNSDVVAEAVITVESTLPSSFEEDDNLGDTQPLTGATVDHRLALGKKIISLVVLVSVISIGFYLVIWPTESTTVPTMSTTRLTTASTTTSATTSSTTPSTKSSTMPSTTSSTTPSTTPSTTSSTTPLTTLSTTPSTTSTTASTTTSKTTSKTTSTTPTQTSPGIFIATAEGLIALNLLTLETAVLTPQAAFAVAVNQNLNKVYWSTRGWDANMMRSNFDGYDQEIIVEYKQNSACSVAGDTITVLAIDDTSGNVYYGLFQSSEIRRCNSVGRNCVVIISSSLYLFKNPYSISLDSENGVIYLTGGSPYSGFIRANVDGTNATKVDGRFTTINSITLDKNSNNLLYWTDEGSHTFGTIDVNGHNKITLVQLEHHRNPAIIQVDDNHIYFGMVRDKAIFSANKHNGKEFKAILNLSTGASGLAMFDIPV